MATDTTGKIATIFDRAKAVGVSLTLTSDNRIYAKGAKMPDDLRKSIEANREALVECVTLRDRLDTGYMKIERAKMDGKPIDSLEAFWIGLLGQYYECMDGELFV